MIGVIISLFCLFPSTTSIEDKKNSTLQTTNFVEPSRGEPRGDIKLLVETTGYTKDDEGMDGRGITTSGTMAKPGVIAVDPTVIPLGSTVIVPGYGTATVEDTGGSIIGNKIDLCFATQEEAFTWGIRTVEITICK